MRHCEYCKSELPDDAHELRQYCNRFCKSRARWQRTKAKEGSVKEDSALPTSAPHDPDAILRALPPEMHEKFLTARAEYDKHLDELTKKSEEGYKRILGIREDNREGGLFKPVREETRTEAYPDDEEKGQ